MDEKFSFIKAYQHNNELRKSFNDLSKTIHAIDFEDWYENGYWKSNYIPYSVFDKTTMVSNVSVSPMQFSYDNKTYNLLQIGTVMTKESYRNNGLIRGLLHEIELDYQDKTDGIFLFANDHVLDFYPKFGYKKYKEYEYFKTLDCNTSKIAERVSLENKANVELIKSAITSSCPQSEFFLQNNMELAMFYITKFMQKNVYYIKSQKAYVVAEENHGILYIYDIFAPNTVNIDKIAFAFGKEVKKIVLGFTPLKKETYDRKEVHEKVLTLFAKGTFFDNMQERYLKIPILAHT